ncbi:transposase [Bernardetia sp. OM2101]|uniref:transposase n=1 Tax=Bernardetia sp. OM2101 TaxID=3344876 RepID=UPI0035CF93A2
MDSVIVFDELLHIVAPFHIRQIDKDELAKKVHVYVEVCSTYRPSAFEDWRIHSYKDREWEHLNIFEYRCFIHCKLPIYQNKITKETSQLKVDFSREFSRFTLLYEQKVMDLLKIYHCFQKVAKQLGIYTQRVEHIYHYYTQDLNENPPLGAVRKIGADETSTKKGHDYITSFIDMETSKIIAIEDGKSGATFEQLALHHPNPNTVKEISIDMSPAFISAANEYFPNAALTFDKWHVIKLLYKHLEKLKKTPIYDSLVLSMEKLESFYENKSIEEAKAQLLFMADFAEEIKPKNPFTKTIYRHFEGIINYFSSKLTNGILEGINSTIQVIKRVARGFRYTHNFKKMIRFIFSDKVYLQPNS